MMNENNTNLPESSQTPESNPTTSEKHEYNRLGYMDQKPQHSRKAFIMLGIALAMVLGLVVGGVYFVSTNAYAALTEYGILPAKEDGAEEEKMFAEAGATDKEIDLESTELAQVLTGDVTGDDDTNGTPDDEDDPVDEEPVYTEEPVALLSILYRLATTRSLRRVLMKNTLVIMYYSRTQSTPFVGTLLPYIKTQRNRSTPQSISIVIF